MGVFGHWLKYDFRKGNPWKMPCRFKRKVQQEDIIKEIKKHSFYLKPGERRRVKEALARKRVRKKARLERD